MSIGRAFTPQVSIPFLIYIAAISTFFSYSQYTIGLNATLAMFVLLMAGDFQGLNSYNENSSAFSFLLDVKYYDKFFLITAIIELLAILSSFLLTDHSVFHTKNPKIKKYKIISILFIFPVIIILSFSIHFLYVYFKSDLRKLEQYIVQLRHFTSMNMSKVMFGKEVDLNRTLNSDLKENHQLIMIRVEGARPPGYLRGRTYDSYIKGKWSKFAGKIHRFNETANIDDLALSAFYMKKKISTEKAIYKFNVYLTDACITNYIFYPPNTKRIEMVAEHLNYSPNGDFLPKSWNKDGGYTAYIYDNPPFPAYYKPKYPKSTHYIFIPREIKNVIASISDNIDAEFNPEHRKLSDMETASQIKMYLQKHYKYTLSPPINRENSDPILFFLTKSKQGHCELFATAAALLLRYRGIPSRYVTGFVCMEQHPSGDYYISRMGNAHAWTEAYLREEKKWILVEATPPDGIVPYKSEWGIFNVWIDKLKYSASKMLSEIRRGYFTKAIINFFFDLFSIIFDILIHPLRGSIFILLCLGVAVFIIHRRKKQTAYSLTLSRETEKLIKTADKFISDIGRKTGIKRNEHETLDEWLKRIEVSDTDIDIDKIRCFVNEYRMLRFAKEKITSDEIAKFSRKSRRILKNSDKI
jgi:hypothetical protein